MKLTRVALAALAVAAAPAMAQSSVTVYGVLDAGILHLSNTSGGVGYLPSAVNNGSVTKMQDGGIGGSNWGLKGSEDLGAGMKANFGLESGTMSLENGTSGGLNFTRASWVGLSGNFGAVNFGAINNGGLDFVSTVAPIQGTSFAGGYGVIIGADPAYGQVRWSNSGQYTTPTFSGFNASYIRANKQTNANTANANFYDAIGRYNILGADELTVRYNNGPLAAIYVYTQTDATGIGSGTKKKMNSLGANYAFGAAKVTAGYQTNKADDGTIDRKAFNLGGFYTMGATTVFVQYGENKENGTISSSAYAGLKTKMTAVGADYALSKTTKLYARYEDVKDAAGILTMASLVGNDGSRNRVRSALGVRYDF